ncbi:MAG: outer membrane protein assembly factor BamD [Salinivirgaceae bacterium]|nr:outer membrane protein assembly factor BamD [Salinivirgaceae bacterium]
MNNRVISFIIVFVCAMLFSNCSEYYKIQKSGDYIMKYQKAKDYYEYEDYYHAKSLLDDVVNVLRGSDKAEESLMLYAYCHYKMHDYTMGAYYFDSFCKTYPYSDRYEESCFMIAQCYYKDSPRVELDQACTQKAIDAMQTYINKYPQGEHLHEANEVIKEMRGKLEEKSFMTAKLYFKLGEYQSATITLKNSLKEYPDTKYREELMYLMVKSNFLLATNSVESKKAERYQNTVTEYYSFVDEFPESKYIPEIENMYKQSVDKIKNL